MTSQEMADKYIEEAEAAASKGECPPNIYKFNSANFRPIDGHDPEWYEVFHAWKKVLESKGWKWFWYDEEEGESTVFNFQYYYKKDLGFKLAPPTIEDLKMFCLAGLNGSMNSQLGLA